SVATGRGARRGARDHLVARRPAGTGAPGADLSSVCLVRRVGGRPGFLGQRGELEYPAGGVLEDLGRLLGRARVELDEQVHDDPLLVVLVEAHVREELTRPRIAEGGVGEAVGRLRSRAGLDGV